MLKPICDFCKTIGEERVYVWFPDRRGKEGRLHHLKCASDVTDIYISMAEGLKRLDEKLKKYND